MKKYKIVELFSGIGSQAKALKNIGMDIDVQATCEWDMHAFIAYDAIHYGTDIIPEAKNKTKEELYDILKNYKLSNNGKEAMAIQTLRSYSEEVLRRMYSALKRTKNHVDVAGMLGEEMPNDTDILTYSFPCQDLSNVGAFHHYNKGIDKGSGSRSSLLWEVGRILTEMKNANKNLPKYLVMENVPTLLSDRHKPNFDKWIDELNELGYKSYYFQLNAKDFGIPQNRPRLLMLSIYVGDDNIKAEKISEYFKDVTSGTIVKDYCESSYYRDITIRELLRIPQDKNSYLWKEAVECTPNDTPSRRKIWDENPKIVNENGMLTTETFIRTITTKQDRHPNSGNIYFDCGLEKRGKFRYLTPRECLLFMGFTDEDYEHIIANNPQQRMRSSLFPRDKIIRMAGNSIPVKLLEGFFFQLHKVDEMLNK
jgi:DNA (cytosine-5)-methyltransferase 1